MRPIICVSGVCPGPAIAGLGTGNWTLLFAVGDWQNGSSDRLIDAVCAWGDATMLADKLGTYAEAGTHIVLYPCNPDEHDTADSAVSRNWHWPLLEALAPI